MQAKALTFVRFTLKVGLAIALIGIVSYWFPWPRAFMMDPIGTLRAKVG